MRAVGTDGLSEPVSDIQCSFVCKFLTPGKGWVAGEKGTILYTEDGGGANWETQESSTEQDLKSIFFINDNQGWAAGTRGAIIRSIKVGRTWVTAQKDLFIKSSFNDKEGWTVGVNGTLLHTREGGSQLTCITDY